MGLGAGRGPGQFVRSRPARLFRVRTASLNVGPGEPVAGPWRVAKIDVFAQELTTASGDPSSRPRVIAIDGRGGSGKSTLAGRLARRFGNSAIVHTDDIAWWHSRFGWDDLMIGGVLEPLHAGRPVHYQPPAWAPRGRTGYIDIPAGTETVFIEGVGASRREVAALIDAAVWVQSDFDGARERGISRDIAELGFDLPKAIGNWDDWQVEEVPFLIQDRPWERAGFVVAGLPVIAYDPDHEILTAPAWRP